MAEKRRKIYLDYAATTPVDSDILEKMLRYYSEDFENPSALYAQNIKFEIENARSQIARAIGAKSSEIVFTSGGTEANNLAILGFARQFQGAHFITSRIEHDSVLEAFFQLEKEGHSVTYLEVDRNGRIDPNQLSESIRENTKMISIMAVNNELGTVQDLNKIVQIAKEAGIVFHTDAVQAIGILPIKKEMADMISLSGHKLYAPKGIGALYVNSHLKIMPQLLGGHQESGRRSGTENVAGIIALGLAVSKAVSNRETECARLKALGEVLRQGLSGVKGMALNADIPEKSAAIYHYSISGIKTEALLTMLSLKGICVSAGSACQAGSYRVSHVIKAIGSDLEGAHLRISLGKNTSQEELEEFMAVLIASISHLRNEN